MSINAIVQIADRLLNRNSSQAAENTGTSNPNQPGHTQANQTEFGDRFTHSDAANPAEAQRDQAFFQFAGFRFTGAAPQASGAAAGIAANATPAVPATTTGTAAAPASVATTTTTAPATAAQTEDDLQSLNSSLSALGLNAAEIAAFDQYASLLLQFDPNGLQDLQNQLQLLASRFQAQSAVPASAQQAPASTPGFQLTELSVSLTAVAGTLQQQTQTGANANNGQLAAVNLQVQEATITLTNPAGGTTQLQTTPANAGGTQTAPAAAAAQAATA